MNNKGKVLKSSLAVLVGVSVFMFSGCSKEAEGVTIIYSEDIQMERGESLEVHYNSEDYYDSLDDIVEHSTMVISGTVENTEDYGDISVISKVNVNDTIYGDEKDAVRVIEIDGVNSSSTLQEGEEYILMLYKQGDEYDDTYYILGHNIQGKFLNRNGQVLNNDEVMRREIQDLAKQKNEEATTTDADSSRELSLAFSDFTDYLKEDFQ